MKRVYFFELFFMVILFVCAGAFSTRAEAQEQIKPYMLIIFDTSGSMAWNVGGSDTRGDGTLDPWNSRWCCPGRDTSGNGVADDSRMYQSKVAIYQVVSSTGDITFGLMKFPQYFVSGHRRMDWYYNNQVSGQYDYLRYNGECSSSTLTDYLVVQFSEESSNEVLMWMDNTEYSSAWTPHSSTERELRADGGTPLGWTVRRARDYFAGTVIPGDSIRDCRPYHTVVLSDGDETCGGNPGDAVHDLYTISYGGTNYHVSTYVIGYAVSNSTLDQMADYGDDGLRNYSAVAERADSTDELAIIFSDIVADSVLIEVCDYVDNDCDCPGDTNGDGTVCGPGDEGVDEGFTLYCDVPGGHPAQDLCTDPGETLCDGVDDNCNGEVDEGLLNACGECGPTPEEICDGLDNDCDGFIDEDDVCGGCTPQPEICNGMDDDCDGRVDEDITRTCGTNVGRCTEGTQQCVEDGTGEWTVCTGIGPIPEVCNGEDDDCDGIVDGITRTCGTDVGECTFGYELCTDGVWGECLGGIGPREEVCDNKDNDCDGEVDEGNPGGGAPCGTEVGLCEEGVLTCTGGVLVCGGGVGPVPELCNGYDDDCDGDTDEGNPEGGAACGPTELDGVGICRAGTIMCITDGYGMAHLECVGAVYPEDETCNCLDDDCNTFVDDGLVEGTQCGATDVGICEYGTLLCDPVACDWACEGEVGPEEELCNGLDDNCDGTVDEGNPEGGGSCGETEGECEPGVLWCSSSDTPPPCEPPDPLPVDPTLLCLCGKGPEAEICDCLDNDCDGDVDEGLSTGEACGSDVGDCEPGVMMCLDCEWTCVGGRGPQSEVCDCNDNDCDGETDEDDPCGGDAVCYHDTSGPTEECYCVEQCNPALEFPCSEPDQVCVYIEGYGDYYCIGDPCEDVECAEDEICRYGECVPICDGVECPEGQVCTVQDGRAICVPADCYSDHPDYQCEEGEICRGGECVPDPCYEVECPEGQFCRDGECYEVCNEDDIVSCNEGEICYDGACVPDPCYGVECPSGEVCDEETGECVGDPCEGVECMPPQVCRDGECVDPPCSFVECPDGYRCVDDTCVAEETLPDVEEEIPEDVPEAAPDAGSDAGDDADRRSWDIMSTGGGGCAGCVVAGGREAGGSAAAFWPALVLLLGLVFRKARRRKGGR